MNPNPNPNPNNPNNLLDTIILLGYKVRMSCIQLWTLVEIAKTLVFPHNFLFSQFPFILIHERGKCFIVLLSNNVYVLEVVLSIVFVRWYLITT